MESNNLEWKTPPKPVRYKRGNVKWHELADQLRTRPNEWALIAHDVNPSLVTHIRQGRLQAFAPNGTFEASGQGRNDRGYTTELYARYVGKPTSKKPRASRKPKATVETPAEETASAPVETVEEVKASAPAEPIFIFNDTASPEDLRRRAEQASSRLESLAPEAETAYADDPEY